MKKTFVFPIMASLLALSGCATSIVGLVCERTRAEQDMRAIQYEAEIEVMVEGEAIVLRRNFSCTPSGYYCGGGKWFANYPRVEDPGFIFQVPVGQIEIPRPNCPQPGEVGATWAPAEGAVSTLTNGSDKYMFTAVELSQPSAPAVVGLQLNRYQLRVQTRR